MDSLSITFAALADPTRRAILGRLAAGDATVGELAQPFTISAPAVSRHLRVLEQAGLISRQVDAQWRLCSLRALPLRDVHEWLDGYRNFWETNLDRLVDLVERDHAQATNAKRPVRSRPTGRTTQPPRARSRSRK